MPIINIKYKALINLFCLLLSVSIFAQHKKNFKVVPLGVLGGIDESNLSAYMIAPAGTNNYVCMDAGTLNYGIEKAIKNGVFKIPAEQVLKQYINGYFISHSHLDHIAGLIINSPDDSPKGIYAFANCIKTIKSHYFTWESWANFANEGEAPLLKKYTYHILIPGVETKIPNNLMQIMALPLSHSNLESTAFLIKNNDSYILYLGDTGADIIEKSNRLQTLWQAVAPLVKSGQLKAIMIEVSFPNEQPDKTLFGHLTPKWLMAEMNTLSKLTGKNALKNFHVVITHVKPPLSSISKIKTQLRAENKLNLKLIFPVQGKELDF
jgi:cAMP phosphodiesterase